MIERVIRAVKLDATLYQEVDVDESKTGEAFVVAIVAAAIGGLLVAFSTDGSIGGLIGKALIGAPIGMIIGAGVLLLIGKLFGGQATYSGMLRGLGYASAPTAVGIIPFLGPIVAWAWGVVATVVAVREIHKISTGQAVVTVLIPTIVLLLLVFLLFAAIIAAMGLSALS